MTDSNHLMSKYTNNTVFSVSTGPSQPCMSVSVSHGDCQLTFSYPCVGVLYWSL